MSFIKNTYKAVKKNPRTFLNVGRGVTDITVDMVRMRREGVSYAWIPMTIKSVGLVISNILEAKSEIADADRISIRIDPNDDITQDVLSGWSSEVLNTSSYTDFSALLVGSEDGLDMAFVPGPGNVQNLPLPNGSEAELIIDNMLIQKNGKDVESSLQSYTIYVDNEEDCKSFSEELSSRVKGFSVPSDRPLKLFTNIGYGFARRDLPKREFESVILKYGQSEHLVSFLDKFFENKDLYEKRGFIHRSGILFYGPPGTGKTSIATAIANKYRRNVYQIQLSAVSTDDELVNLFSDIPSDSVVLLEDIDVAVKSKNRSGSSPTSDSGISLAALLNVIDGNFAPDDALFIMTTNDKDALDPALTRPGRTDLHVRVGFLDNEQLDRMCDYYLGFVPEGLPDISETDIEPAKVISIFREHVLDSVAAGKSLVEELKEKVSID